VEWRQVAYGRQWRLVKALLETKTFIYGGGAGLFSLLEGLPADSECHNSKTLFIQMPLNIS
jgi:hypothetical protein